ncbi:MAG: type II toxin-antitoxin system YafQ family toxin [Bacilli bacterium]|nr:type II toxin-antitoxin system YafQ family toxin [Bacilli bacterium]
MTMEVKHTNQFKKDFKLAEKRQLKIELLRKIIESLAMGEKLPEKCRDHALISNWSGHRVCHIQPDWLLIYSIEVSTKTLILTRTGTHSDLFDS